MPKGPRGERRPADVIGAAAKVMRMAIGEETEDLEPETPASAAAQLGKLGRGGSGAEAHGRAAEGDCPEGGSEAMERLQGKLISGQYCY
jgi:hypothetical protein